MAFQKKPPRHWDLSIVVTVYLKGAEANLALNVNCSQTCLYKRKSRGRCCPYLNTAESYKYKMVKRISLFYITTAGCYLPLSY